MADADDTNTPPPPPAAEDVEAQRRRVFEGLPPELQANPEIRKSFGLGDAVELAARPFARMLGLRNCSGCKKRKIWLDKQGEAAAAKVRDFLRGSRNTE